METARLHVKKMVEVRETGNLFGVALKMYVLLGMVYCLARALASATQCTAGDYNIQPLVK